MTQFDHLPAAISEALAEKGYATLTPVQEAVSGPEHAGRDLLVSAQTGSGKTVAFGLAIASDLLGEGGLSPFPGLPLALIVAPTRELAQQNARELEWLYNKAGAVMAGAVGGMDARNERRALERGAHIVVGTPGRICDHIRRGALDLSELKAVVLDEADEMLDLGFREDLEYILEAAPESRRTLMFSATVSPGIAKLAGQYQREAERISTIAAREQHADIRYEAVLVDKTDREHAIVNLLRYHEPERAILFCSTRAEVARLSGRLLNRGFSVVSLSGELTQEERSRGLQMLRDGRARVCVATDVAARGIDLPGLELVIHADLPINREALLHRSGRTGRAGKKGISALIVPLNARGRAERLLREAGVQPEWVPAPSPEAIFARDRERLLSDPRLTAPVTGDEAADVETLLSAFEPRQLAAAAARAFRAERAAPEDIAPVTAEGPKPRDRAEFDRATWIRLTMGHDQYVDPKWLLPMLCRAGDLTRRDIGAIRVMEDHTFVQIHADAADRFVAALGEERMLEGKCGVDILDAPPAGLDRPAPKPARWSKDRPGKPSFSRDGAAGRTPKPHRKGVRPEAASDEADHHAPKGRKSAPWAREGGHGGAGAGKSAGGKPAGGKPSFGKPAFGKAAKPTAKYGKPNAKNGPGKSGPRGGAGRAGGK